MAVENYRERFCENLKALMDARGYRPPTLKAYYLSTATKPGEPVSYRAIQDFYAGKMISSPSLDMIAAVAARLGVEPYMLLVPDLDPSSQPTAVAETWIENEVARRVAARLPKAIKIKKTLEVPGEKAVAGRPSSAFPFVGGKVPAKGKAGAPQAPAKPAARPKARAK